MGVCLHVMSTKLRVWAWFSMKTRTHAGAQTGKKKYCTYEAEAQFWQSDLADGASQRVGSSETGMRVGGFYHAQFELGLVDWHRR